MVHVRVAVEDVDGNIAARGETSTGAVHVCLVEMSKDGIGTVYEEVISPCTDWLCTYSYVNSLIRLFAFNQLFLSNSIAVLAPTSRIFHSFIL